MTDRLAKLVALRKAVETGKPIRAPDARSLWLENGIWREACLASQGSTDAALTLRRAVLPGVPWSIMFEPDDEGHEYYASMNHHTNDEMLFIHELAPTLARALLLAMLSALIERERTG